MDPEKFKADFEKLVRDKRAAGTLATKNLPKDKILTRIAATLQSNGNFRSELQTVKGNSFIYYPNATVVRVPNTGCNVRIQGSPPDPAKVEVDVGKVKAALGMNDGFYIMKDGSVVITMPNNGGIDLFVDDDKSPQALADDGFNYKC